MFSAVQGSARQLSSNFITGPASAGAFSVAHWVVPVLAILLILPLALSVPQQRLLQSATSRASALRLSRRDRLDRGDGVPITIANAAAIVLLVRLLIAGSHTEARVLLRGGDPHVGDERARVCALVLAARRRRPDPAPADAASRARLPLHTEQTLADGAGTGWQPTFMDYLFLSYTNATAFSTTDTLPLSHWAKLLMIAESAASLLLAIMVVARAVNNVR